MDTTEELQPLAPAAEAANKCISCATHLYAPAQRTPLCPGCREQFIRYPFPLWVRAFGGVVLLLLLVSLFTLPNSIGAGIHYQRAKTAQEKHNYLTAQKELQLVVQKQPLFVDARCRLILAAFYNNDLATMAAAYENVVGKETKDDHLVEQVKTVMETAAASYFPGDSFASFTHRYPAPATAIPVPAYCAYLAQNTHDDYARMQLSGILFDKHQYRACDSLLDIALQDDPSYLYALSLKMPLKREMGELDSSLFYIDRTLAINHEYTYAYASKVKALLKQKKDQEALQCAKKAYALDEKDGYVMASLALAYHFNKDAANRDAIIALSRHDSAAAAAMTSVKDVLSGKEKFRDQ